MKIIDYRNVTIRQQEKEILRGVDLTLNEGEFTYLIGEVGSGKSSLLKTMYGEVDIFEGEASLFGCDLRSIRRKQLPSLRRRIGIVFQDFQLLTDRTVNENLDFVLRCTGWKSPVDRQRRIEEVLELIGLQTKGYKLPNELSGGEQQRVAIARAILNRPKLILADEPTGNLDARTGRLIVGLLHRICQQGTAVLMITHQEQWIKEFPGNVVQCKNNTLVALTAEQADSAIDEIEEAAETEEAAAIEPEEAATIETEAAAIEPEEADDEEQKEAATEESPTPPATAESGEEAEKETEEKAAEREEKEETPI